VAGRSKAWVCGRSLAETVGLNPTGGMDVVLSGRCLCVGLITRQEESWHVYVCVSMNVTNAKITLYIYNELVEDVRIRKKKE
jgi:hypothetical protein